MRSLLGIVLYFFAVMALMEVTCSHPWIGTLALFAVAGTASVRH